MIPAKGWQFMVKLLVVTVGGPPPRVPGIWFESQSLIDATSNLGGAGAFCARVGGAYRTPMRIGAATAARPIIARVIRFMPFNSAPMLPARIARRRFLTSAPVTPEMHGSGGSVEKRQ